MSKTTPTMNISRRINRRFIVYTQENHYNLGPSQLNFPNKITRLVGKSKREVNGPVAQLG